MVRITGDSEEQLSGQRAGEANSASFRYFWAMSCSGPNSIGMNVLAVRCTRELAHFTKFWINMWHTPIVLRKAKMSMYFRLGSQPCGVQWCLTAIISLAHKADLKNLLKVLLQYLTCYMTQLMLWKCSQMNWWMPELSGICFSMLSKTIECPSRPWMGTLSMYGMVVSGIFGWRIQVTLSWKI